LECHLKSREAKPPEDLASADAKEDDAYRAAKQQYAEIKERDIGFC
jgi:hypothetical protein